MISHAHPCKYWSNDEFYRVPIEPAPNEWNAERPPTVEEVADYDICWVTCRGGEVRPFPGLMVRDWFGHADGDDPIAWKKIPAERPAPYREPKSPQPGEWWRRRDGGEAYVLAVAPEWLDHNRSVYCFHKDGFNTCLKSGRVCEDVDNNRDLVELIPDHPDRFCEE